MTKSETIAQLVPQTSNAASEAIAILTVTATIAFAAYFCLGYAICWLEDFRTRRLIGTERKVRA